MTSVHDFWEPEPHYGFLHVTVCNYDNEIIHVEELFIIRNGISRNQSLKKRKRRGQEKKIHVSFFQAEEFFVLLDELDEYGQNHSCINHRINRRQTIL